MATGQTMLDWCVEQIRSLATRVTTLEQRSRSGPGAPAPIAGAVPQGALAQAASVLGVAPAPADIYAPGTSPEPAPSPAVSVEGAQALALVAAIERDYEKGTPPEAGDNPAEFRALRTAELIGRLQGAGPGLKNLAVHALHFASELAQREQAPVPAPAPPGVTYGPGAAPGAV